ncbi:MAG: DUF6585 family protein [Cyanobacteria bacterium P01_E01_bin.34]
MSQTLDIETVVRKLGPALEEYRADPVQARARQIFGSWLVLSAGVLFVGAAIWGVMATNGTLTLFILLAILVGALGMPLGSLLVVSAVREQRTRVLIFERGLALEQPRKVECLSWDDISTVRMKSRPWRDGTVYSCRLRLRDGKQVTFAKHSARFPGITKLCDRVQLELTSRHFPAALEAFDEGRDLQFGPITINRWGLSKGERLLQWESIDEVQLYQGAISVFYYPHTSQTKIDRTQLVERGELQLLTWPDATPDTVPNIFVLLTLIQQIVPRKLPRSKHSS